MPQGQPLNRELDYYLNLPYSVQLSKQSDDGDEYWLAAIVELPGCIADGDSPDEAVESIGEAKRIWIESHLEDGHEVPLPLEYHDYGGRVLVRMAKSLHARLSRRAKLEGVSLNQYIVTRLAEHSDQGEEYKGYLKTIRSLVDQLVQQNQPAQQIRAAQLSLTRSGYSQQRTWLLDIVEQITKDREKAMDTNPADIWLLLNDRFSEFYRGERPSELFSGSHGWQFRWLAEANTELLPPHLISHEYGETTQEVEV